MALKSFRAALFAAKHFAAETISGARQYFASLGGWGGPLPEKKKRKPGKVIDVVAEALPLDTVSRLRDEMLAASLTQDVLTRAAVHEKERVRVKRLRADEEALLLML